MTLTSFLDVKADPPKPDETKVDLLRNLNNETALVVNAHEQLPSADSLQTVEYVELYNHRVAKRRRLCRALAWLLGLFLLLDIGVVLYIGLRMRHAAAGEPGRAATVTCRLRFRSSDQVDRSELITANSKRILMQPVWAADGRPTVMYDLNRGFTLLRAPSVRMCFIKHAWRRSNWASVVSRWAKESHDVRPEQARFIRLAVMHPAISLEQLMSYGTAAWNMCSRYSTHLVEPVIVKPTSECPMFKCLPCRGGFYLRDGNGCQTCACASGDDSTNRSRRAADNSGGGAPRRRTLELDEGVLPGEDGRAVHTIDVIEF